MTHNEARGVLRALVGKTDPADDDAYTALDTLEADYDLLSDRYDNARSDLEDRERELSTADEERDVLLAAVRDLLDGHPGAAESLRLAMDKVDSDYRQPVRSPWTGQVIR